MVFTSVPGYPRQYLLLVRADPTGLTIGHYLAARETLHLVTSHRSPSQCEIDVR
jgi:hypothetical protein